MRNPRPTGQAWTQVQHGLSDLLVSPAAKRRAAIELKPPGPDTDEVAAVSMIGRYRQRVSSRSDLCSAGRNDWQNTIQQDRAIAKIGASARGRPGSPTPSGRCQINVLAHNRFTE